MIFKNDIVILSEFCRVYGCIPGNFYIKREKMHRKIGKVAYILKKDIINANSSYYCRTNGKSTKERYLEAFEKCTNLKGMFHISSTLSEWGYAKQNYYKFLYDVELQQIGGKGRHIFGKPKEDGVFDRIFSLIDDGYTAMFCEPNDEYMDYIFRVSGQRYLGLWK